MLCVVCVVLTQVNACKDTVVLIMHTDKALIKLIEQPGNPELNDPFPLNLISTL